MEHRPSRARPVLAAATWVLGSVLGGVLGVVVVTGMIDIFGRYHIAAVLVCIAGCLVAFVAACWVGAGDEDLTNLTTGGLFGGLFVIAWVLGTGAIVVGYSDGPTDDVVVPVTALAGLVVFPMSLGGILMNLPDSVQERADAFMGRVEWAVRLIELARTIGEWFKIIGEWFKHCEA